MGSPAQADFQDLRRDWSPRRIGLKQNGGHHQREIGLERGLVHEATGEGVRDEQAIELLQYAQECAKRTPHTIYGMRSSLFFVI